MGVGWPSQGDVYTPGGGSRSADLCSSPRSGENPRSFILIDIYPGIPARCGRAWTLLDIGKPRSERREGGGEGGGGR